MHPSDRPSNSTGPKNPKPDKIFILDDPHQDELEPIRIEDDAEEGAPVHDNQEDIAPKSAWPLHVKILLGIICIPFIIPLVRLAEALLVFLVRLFV